MDEVLIHGRVVALSQHQEAGRSCLGRLALMSTLVEESPDAFHQRSLYRREQCGANLILTRSGRIVEAVGPGLEELPENRDNALESQDSNRQGR